MANNTNVSKAIGVAAIAGALLYLLYKMYEKDKEINDLKLLNEEKDLVAEELFNQLKATYEAIENTPGIDQKLMSDIKDLISRYEGVQDEVVVDLKSSLNMIMIGEYHAAAVKQAIIIESLLKKMYKKLPKFKEYLKSINEGKSTSATFENCINYGAKYQDFDTREVTFLHSIRTVRNKESHDYGQQTDLNFILANLLSSVKFIFKFAPKERSVETVKLIKNV